MHIISSGITIVGVLSKTLLNDLYIAFPLLKDKMRILNKHFAKYSIKYLKHKMAMKQVEYSHQNAIDYISHHYSYSDQKVYNQIRENLSSIDLKSEDIAKHDIVIKQKAVLLKSLIKRVSSGNKPLDNSDLKRDRIYLDKDKPTSCFSWFQFNKNSKYRKLIDFCHLINLLYIAASVPLYIGFDVRMEWELILIEDISLLISVANLTINMRTPVILRSGATLELKTVLKYYYHNGLILDIIALWPLNLILGGADIIYPIWIVTPVRLFRLISIFRIIDIFETLEKYFKKYTLLVTLIKSSLFIGLVLHMAS